MNRKSTKKMLALLLAAMMSVSVLAGCNQNEQSETQQSTEETTEQTTEQASEENTDAESTESESTSGEEASTQNTEKITLSDESGLPQFNNPAEDSEVAVIHTTAGDISVMFFPEYAPKAVENFLTHAKEGYYDGVSFHRVIDNFMIQGGDPKGDGTGGESIWGKEFENEVSDKMFNFNGAMAMANAGPDTNGSQFFIVQASSIPDGYDALMQQSGFPQEAIDKYNEVGGAPWLDGSYTVFGQVFDGMDVVNKIVEETSENTDENGIVPEDERAIIESITVAPATDYFNYAE
mgnify:FL=1